MARCWRWSGTLALAALWSSSRGKSLVCPARGAQRVAHRMGGGGSSTVLACSPATLSALIFASSSWLFKPVCIPRLWLVGSLGLRQVRAPVGGGRAQPPGPHTPPAAEPAPRQARLLRRPAPQDADGAAPNKMMTPALVRLLPALPARTPPRPALLHSHGHSLPTRTPAARHAFFAQLCPCLDASQVLMPSL